MVHGPQTSFQGFVKALKGASNPPEPNGPLKIELAWQAWQDEQFFLPNKAEVLAGWLFSTLSREKVKDVPTSPANASVQHWSLLAAILTPVEGNTSTPKDKQSTKFHPWLPPLLNHFSVVSAVSSLLKQFAIKKAAPDIELLEPFTRCIKYLWPLAISRTNIDFLFTCFGELLGFLCAVSHEKDLQNRHVEDIGLLVTSSFRTAFSNAANKKKIHANFLQHHLHHWMLCRSIMNDPKLVTTYSILRKEIFDSGVAVLFSVDVLRGSDVSATCTQTAAITLPLLRQDHPDVALILPDVFEEYVAAVRKHRYALFGSGSSHTHSQDATLQKPVKDAVMRAFVAVYNCLKEAGDKEQFWQAMVELARKLEQAGNVVDLRDKEHADAAREVVSYALKGLKNLTGSNACFVQALELLTVMSRIDFDVVLPQLPAILAAILNASSSVNRQLLPLLQLILVYHVKVRSLDTYAKLLLQCIRSSVTDRSSKDYRETLSRLASTAILSMPHLEMLARNMKSFITPEQTPEVVKSTFECLEDIWKEFQATISEHKKGKAAASRAVVYRVATIFAATILSSLSYETLLPQSTDIVQSIILKAWDGFLTDSIGTHMNSVGSSSATWASQTVTTASLRLRYILTEPSSSSHYLLSNGRTSNKSYPLDVIAGESMTPELKIEIFRHLMRSHPRIKVPEANMKTTIDVLLAIFEQELKPENKIRWNGSSTSLDDITDDGHQSKAAVILWYLNLQFWLPSMDLLASKEQMHRFVAIFIDHLSTYSEKGVPEDGHITVIWAIKQATSSAAFWELPSLRNALISLLRERCAFLYDLDMNALLAKVQSLFSRSGRSHKKKHELLLSEKQIQTTVAAYRLICLAPLEFLPRAFRSDFIRHGLVADFAILLHCQHLPAEATTSLSTWRASLRLWMSKMMRNFGFVEILTESVKLLRCFADSQPSGIEDSGTASLLSVAYKQLIRQAVDGDSEKLLEILRGIDITASTKDSTSTLDIVNWNELGILQLIMSECSSSSTLSSSLAASLGKLVQDMKAPLFEQMSMLLHDELYTSSIPRLIVTVKAWCLCLNLMNWLRLDVETQVILGSSILAKLSTLQYPVEPHAFHDVLEELHGAVFTLLLAELKLRPQEHQSDQFGLITAAYVHFLRKASRHSDVRIVEAYKILPPDLYGQQLEYLSDLLSSDTKSQAQDVQGSLLRLAVMLTKAAPEGASKLTNRIFVQSLQIFVDDASYIIGNSDRCLLALDYIGYHCSHRPASLKPLDISLILSFLCKITSGSTTHSTTTYTPICRGIVDIVSALIRMRRDLVSLSLPMLSMVLRQLLLLLRAVRLQLGAKQSMMVTNTLPWWICASEPLGSEEAKAVARLLSTLSTKTLHRSHAAMTSAETQKTGSLARQFGRHAPYVLMAYIEAMDDPLCILSSGVRKELQPGLFSLCDMMTERSRDAIMISAPTSGQQTALKMLWKEFEKQRYGGSG